MRIKKQNKNRPSLDCIFNKVIGLESISYNDLNNDEWAYCLKCDIIDFTGTVAFMYGKAIYGLKEYFKTKHYKDELTHAHNSLDSFLVKIIGSKNYWE